MNEKQWHADSDLRGNLAALLREPTLKTALQITRDLELDMVIPPAGADLLHWYAIVGAQREGFLKALNYLIGLSELPKRPREDRKPWTTEPETQK